MDKSLSFLLQRPTITTRNHQRSTLVNTVTYAITVLDQGAEAVISDGQQHVTLWAPDGAQAKQLAQLVIARHQDNNVSLAAACATVHRGAGPYANLLSEALQDTGEPDIPTTAGFDYT